MDILGLTSSNQIRGVLTVSVRDLPDSVVEDYDLATDLEVDLEGWLGDYTTTLAGDAALAKLVKLYAKYRCAAWLAASGQNFLYTQMSDGTNQAQRSDTEGFQTLRLHLESRALFYRQKADEQRSEATAANVTLLGRATPTRDPVTETRS
jgi:hypothetical protein